MYREVGVKIDSRNLDMSSITVEEDTTVKSVDWSKMSKGISWL
jgi:hypothetical protein